MISRLFRCCMGCFSLLAADVSTHSDVKSVGVSFSYDEIYSCSFQLPVVFVYDVNDVESVIGASPISHLMKCVISKSIADLSLSNEDREVCERSLEFVLGYRRVLEFGDMSSSYDSVNKVFCKSSFVKSSKDCAVPLISVEVCSADFK